MSDRAEYEVLTTCTTTAGRYLLEGRRIVLSIEEGAGNAHLIRVDAEPTPSTLSIASAPSARRKKQSSA